jgi:hypothetical protein
MASALKKCRREVPCDDHSDPEAYSVVREGMQSTLFAVLIGLLTPRELGPTLTGDMTVPQDYSA